MRHRWKNNHCIHCGLKRERRTWKLRMAIVGNRDYYQYGTAIAYWINKQWTFKRPDCISRETIVVVDYQSVYKPATGQ